VKLDRALYGCKESALLWYEEISSFLISIGLRKSGEDDCLFLKDHGEDTLHVAVFIDDFLLFNEPSGNQISRKIPRG
jgi:hypothetical protein